MENFEFGVLNWTILVVYVIGNLVLGWFVGKNVNTADDFYVGQKVIPWWAIGLSVVATYVSALSFLGGPAWSYGSGLSVIAIHLNYPIVIFLVITYFLPFFYNSGVASIYDYQERRFGKSSRSVMALIFLISQALTSAAILYATSLILQFITGMNVEVAIVITVIIALVYTYMGGISAVIWTDVIQAGVLLVGTAIIFYGLIDSLPMSLGDTLASLKEEGKTQSVNFSVNFTQDTTIWAGVLAMTLYHSTVYGGNQMMVQRTLAAKNIGDAKKSYLMMGYLAFFVYFLFVFLGILLYSYFEGREFENGNTIILEFAAEYGVPGLMGIIAAAVVAASMSSLDSSFNSLSTVTTIDFYQKYFKKDASPEHYLKATRIFTILWAILIIFPAIMYASSEGSILKTLSKIGSYFIGAKLAMYGLGFFSKHTTEKGLLIGVGAGFVMIWWLATSTDIAWPWYCVFGAAVNIGVSLPLSIMLDGKKDVWHPYTIKGQIAKCAEEGLPEKDGNWYQIPGMVDKSSWLLIVFFVATVIFLIAFESFIG